MASASTSTGSASEAGCPDDEVPTTCSLSWPGWACGTTTEVSNFPFEPMTAEPTTTRFGSSTTILTWLSGLKPAPLSGTRWPALAWLGADTIGEAEIPGGDWRAVDVVGGLRVVVVVVVLLEVVEVGAVVEVVDDGTVVAVVAVVDTEVTVDAVEVIAGVEEGELSGVVRRVGLTTCGIVVDVVEVDVVVVPLAVLGGVWGATRPVVVVVGEVLAVAPGGVCGAVVLVVDGLVVSVCSPAAAPVEVGVLVVVLEDAEVLDDGVVLELVAVVVLAAVVVGDVVVVTDDVGTVVVVLGVVVVTLVLVVVVVVAAVVVVAEDDGGNNGVDSGVDSEVVSAAAGPSGSSATVKPRPVTNTAPQNVATSRGSHLLEL